MAYTAEVAEEKVSNLSISSFTGNWIIRSEYALSREISPVSGVDWQSNVDRPATSCQGTPNSVSTYSDEAALFDTGDSQSVVVENPDFC